MCDLRHGFHIYSCTTLQSKYSYNVQIYGNDVKTDQTNFVDNHTLDCIWSVEMMK